jgi:cytochrome c-type biogenesis protein CcmE
MSKKSLRALLSALAIGGTLAVLLVVTMRGDAMYFREVDEVMAQPALYQGKTFKMHGYVVEDSIKRRGSSLDYRFEVRNGESVIAASYTGLVPDTFKGGAEVVLTGRLSETGFQVEPNGVTAKCPSKYEEQAKAGYSHPAGVPMTKSPEN